MVASTGSRPLPMDELLRVVPRFMDRTSRQVELSRILLGHVPCIGERMISVGLAKRTDPRPVAAPTLNGAVQVAGDTRIAVDDGPDGPVATDPGADTIDGAKTPSASAVPSDPLPVEGDLAIPEYDSLAASQVIPRLEMLRPEDLRLVLRYEENKRNRQTIVHKVGQLLATATDL